MAKDQYRELSKTDTENGKDVVDYFMEIYNESAIPNDLTFTFQVNSKQKQLCKLSKIPDQYAVIMKCDLIVQFREEYFDGFEDEVKDILIEEQINRVNYNFDKDILKLEKENFICNKGVVQKYSYEIVKEAHELEEQFEEQLKEMKKDNKQQ